MEQSKRYDAAVAVLRDGRLSVSEVAAKLGGRDTVYVWLARYEDGGPEGLADRSHRPLRSPLQMTADAKARVLEPAVIDLQKKGKPPFDVRTPSHRKPGVTIYRESLGPSKMASCRHRASPADLNVGNPNWRQEGLASELQDRCGA